jgi:hypothetical protein
VRPGARGRIGLTGVHFLADHGETDRTDALNLAQINFGKLSTYVTAYVKAHHIRRGGFVAAIAAAAVVFFGLGAFIRLLVGPVSLGPFSDRLSQAMTNALPGLTVRYDQAALEWSREDGRINIVVLGARVFDTDGRIIAQAPKAELALAAGPLLLHGDVELRRIALVGVQLTLLRTRSGEIRLGVEKGHGDSDILKRITDAINAKNSKQSSLQMFAVRNARIAFYDEATGLFLVAPRADMQVQTAGNDLAASLDADIEVSGHPARVVLDVKLPSDAKPASGAISLSGLSLDALGSNAKAFQTLKGLKLTTDMSASFVLTSDNRMRYVDFGIGAAGTVAIRGLIHGPMRVQTIRAVGRYDGFSGRVLLDDLKLRSDGAEAHGRGQIDIRRGQNHRIASARFDIGVDQIAVNMPGFFQQAFKLNSASLRGVWLAATDEFDVERFAIAGGPFSATASGRIVREGDASPAIQAQLSIGALGIRDLLRYWPKMVARGAWEWVDRNMKSGRIGPLVALARISAGAMDAPALPEDSLNVSAPLSGVTMTYFHSLTPMTDVTGQVKLTGDSFAADVAGGKIGSLLLSGGHVVIPQLHADTNVADITVHGQGRLADILRLIDMDPLHYATRFHIDPNTTSGTAGLDIAFKVPTRHDTTDKDIKIGIKSALKDLELSLGDRMRVSRGMLDLSIDNNHLQAVGDVSLFGSRLAVNWNEVFEPARNQLSSHIDVKGSLDDATREAMNFHSGDYLKGTVSASAVLTGQKGQIRHADMTMDVTPATLGVDYLGISKPPGVPGTAVVSATFGPDGIIQAETMKIMGNGISADGSASFDSKGNLTQVRFPQVNAGPANDFSFVMTKSATAGSDILVRGRSLDGSKIGRRGAADVTTPATAKQGEEGSDPFHITARLDHLALRNGVTISPFALDISGFGERPQTMSLAGTMGKGQIGGSIAPGDGGRRITLNADDTGMLLNGLFGFTSLKGGTLVVSATLPGRADAAHRAPAGGPEFQGTATVTNFRIVDQPFLTRLFSAGSLTGIVNLMSGKGIEFSKLILPFSSRNGVISIREARASGGAIGMTADGYLDRPRNQLALKGSLVPIFGVNSILGAIPVLGNLLVSKKGEGVFGMTYSAQGNADEPKISVNPLSMLTPGIFRRIFEGRVPVDAQLSQLPQTPAPAEPAQRQNN